MSMEMEMSAERCQWKWSVELQDDFFQEVSEIIKEEEEEEKKM